MRWFVPLLLLAGCLDYEVTIETTVKEDGSFRRTVAIHEKSDEPKTWKRYDPPKAPYELSGSEKKGFLATLDGKAGVHSGGLRVLQEDHEGKYDGAIDDAPAFEGEVHVEVDDLIIGKLFRYRETIQLGIDTAQFRKEFDWALELGLSVLIAGFELLEPEVDFKPVRENARKHILPELRSSALVVHSELISLANGDRARLESARPDAISSILAELKRIGLQKEGKLESMEDLFRDDSKWTVDDRMWNRLLAPLEDATPEWKAALKKKIFEPADGEELQEDVFERAVPEAERDAVEKRFLGFLRSGLGSLLVQNLFDKHRTTVRVRLPGKLLTADGAFLHRLPEVEWRRDEFNLLNPTFSATSFLPSKRMVGRIADVSALLEFGKALATATDYERAAIGNFLDIAKDRGLAAARKETEGKFDALKALHRALAAE